MACPVHDWFGHCLRTDDACAFWKLASSIPIRVRSYLSQYSFNAKEGPAMKKPSRLVATLAILNLMLLWKGAAFGAGAPAAQQSQGSVIALVDIGYIFDNHARFKQQMSALTKDVETIQRDIAEDEKDIIKQREKLQTFNPGSPEYKKLEEEIARRLSDLQVTKQLKKKESREREAKIFYDTYMEISREVARLADQYGLDLVLRFESQEIDPRNPA